MIISDKFSVYFAEVYNPHPIKNSCLGSRAAVADGGTRAPRDAPHPLGRRAAAPRDAPCRSSVRNRKEKRLERGSARLEVLLSKSVQVESLLGDDSLPLRQVGHPVSLDFLRSNDVCLALVRKYRLGAGWAAEARARR